MTVYEYSPQKSNKKALGVTIILLSIAIGLFAFTMLFPTLPYRWGLQLIAIVAFVAVVFIISRFIAKTFLYAIVENENGLDFTVTEITNAGRTRITVCRISLSNIEESHLLDCSNSKNIENLKIIQKQAKSDGRKAFNYCPDINPAEVAILLVEECGEKFILKISPDSTLWGYLKK